MHRAVSSEVESLMGSVPVPLRTKKQSRTKNDAESLLGSVQEAALDSTALGSLPSVKSNKNVEDYRKQSTEHGKKNKKDSVRQSLVNTSNESFTNSGKKSYRKGVRKKAKERWLLR